MRKSTKLLCAGLGIVLSLISNADLPGQGVVPDSAMAAKLPYKEVFEYKKPPDGKGRQLLIGEAGTLSQEPGEAGQGLMHFGNTQYVYKYTNREAVLLKGGSTVSKLNKTLTIGENQYTIRNQSDNLYLYQHEELIFLYSDNLEKGGGSVTIYAANPLTDEQRVSLLTIGFYRIELHKRTTTRLVLSLLLLVAGIVAASAG